MTPKEPHSTTGNLFCFKNGRRPWDSAHPRAGQRPFLEMPSNPAARGQTSGSHPCLWSLSCVTQGGPLTSLCLRSLSP